MKPLETYRGFINTWECDENDHVNVQFYFERFEIAARAAWLLCGERFGPDRLRSRHVRFHRECRAADLLVGDSARVDGQGTERDEAVQHRLLNAETGALLATALDHYDAPDAVPGDLVTLPLHADAGPRGLDDVFDREPGDDATLGASGYPVTYRGLVRPGDVGPEGLMDERFFIARVTDAVAHAWTHAGITGQWLSDHGLGRVAVEMKLSIAGRPKAGAMVHVRSAPVGLGRSTITFRHALFDSETGQAFATLQVVAVIMDLETRRAVAIPEGLRDGARAALVS